MGFVCRSLNEAVAARMLLDTEQKRTKAKRTKTYTVELSVPFLIPFEENQPLLLFSVHILWPAWLELDGPERNGLLSVARGNCLAVTGEQGQLVDTHQPHFVLFFVFFIVSCLRNLKKGCCVLIRRIEIGRGVDGEVQDLSVCSTVTVPVKYDYVLC